MVDIETQLRAYGATLDSLIDDEETSVRAAPNGSTGSNVSRLAAVGLVTACVVGLAALVLTRQSGGESVTGDLASNAPAETAVTDAPTGAPDTDWPESSIAACLAETADYPAQFGAPPQPDDPAEMLPLADDLVRVTVNGTEVTVACTVSAGDGPLTVSDVSVGRRRVELPVAVDGVAVDDQSWMSDTAEGATGPGWYEVSGRVGGDVVALSIVLPDGSTAPVTLSSGDFYGKIDVAAGVPLFDEVLTWTLADGSSRMSRSDLLDEVSTAEGCASTPGCVDTRIEQLRSSASGVDAEVLADGVVTEDEYRAALQRVADCANAAGGQVEVIGSTLAVSGLTDSSLIDRCQVEHVSTISEVRGLLDARDRITGS